MKYNIWAAIAVICLLLNLTGCSTLSNSPSTQTSKPEPIKVPQISSSEKGWHYARFRFPFAKDAKPNWSMGALVAGEVIQPVLKKHRTNIDLWRFHRRAGRDAHGHVFSFIFYSQKNTAADIYRDIQANSLLQQLEKEKKLSMLKPDDLSKNPRPNIEDTSDKSWSGIVQKTWPQYIMGVSQMWLDLVTQINNDQDQIIKPEVRYQKVQTVVTQIWQGEGKHALLHHLNAIYAYQPLLMRY